MYTISEPIGNHIIKTRSARYLVYLIGMVCISGCGLNSSKVDKDYIENLEKKNKILEKELQEIKRERASGHSNGSSSLKHYFTVGSSENKVIEVMGQPSAYIKTAPEAKKFIYGLSTVYFYQGKVISYDNLDENLQVRVK